MRVGLIARADKTGLGIQTYEFYKHMNPDKVMVVDLSHCSGQSPDMSLYPDASVWHDGQYPLVGIRPDSVVDEFLEDLDLVFTCETPYSFYLLKKAREMGVKTIQQYNFEFLDYLHFKDLPRPDLLAAPSPWRMDFVRQQLPSQKLIHLPVPVNRELLPYKKRTHLSKILHTAGTPAMEDRNGTYVIAEAMKHVKSPVTLEIKTQKALNVQGDNINVDHSDYPNYFDLYGDEDAYAMPRKFGGLCLPINEAMSVGMPVIASKVDPQTTWIPEGLLVEGAVKKQIYTKCHIDVFETDPVKLAERIDFLHDHPEIFEAFSVQMDDIITAYSWAHLKPLYERVFDEVVSGD